MQFRFGFVKVAAVLCAASAFANQAEWRYVAPGIFRGISGAAIESREDGKFTFLVVFDNKKKGDDTKKPESLSRAGLLTVTRDGWPVLHPLDWKETEEMPRPSDLECLSTIPGRTGQYMAMTSKGDAYRISIDKPASTVVVHEMFKMPNLTKNSEAEGLSLQELDGEIVAIYGDRGNSPTAGTLFFTTLDRTTLKPKSDVKSVSIRAPWPDIELTRAISDLKLDASGALFVTWAWETDDDNGPFSSGLTCEGTLVREPL